MSTPYTAKATLIINAPPADVWDALTDPAMIKELMWGTDAISEWEVGSTLVFRGEWQGTSYEDKGEILQMVPERLFQYTYFSAMSGQEDKPENYNRITYELDPERNGTRLSISQEGCRDEKARQHSEQNWTSLLQHMNDLLLKKSR